MERANVIGDYANKSYYICGDNTRYRKMKQWSPTSVVQAPSIFKRNQETGEEVQLSGKLNDYEIGEDVDNECKKLAKQIATAIVNEYSAESNLEYDSSEDEQLKDRHTRI